MGRPLARPLKIGLYSPFFGSTFGGGEKYLGATAEVLRDAFPDAQVEVLSPVPVDVDRYERMLGVDLAGVRFKSANPRLGGLRRHLAKVSALRRLRDLAVSAQAARGTAAYDLFLSMIYVLPAVTRARRSVILCQFPYDLRHAPSHHRLVRRVLLGKEVEDFELVICQSQYVQRWARTIWGRDSLVVNPPIDIPKQEPAWEGKERMILGVGRFFASGHSKRHDLMVEVFRGLCDAGHRGWELHLAGSLHRSYAADLEYFERVCRLAEGYPIHIHVDLPRNSLFDLYWRASIYWHAAGFGVDADAQPAELEHFGMTTVEAMSHGAVPVAIEGGGQIEVVEDGVTGFLWSDLPQLRARTIDLIQDGEMRRRMGQKARHASFRYSRAEFGRRMVAAVGPIVRELEAELAVQSGA